MKIPLKEKPRRCNVEASEPKLNLALNETDNTQHKPQRKAKKGPVTDNPDLWKRVAPGAKWRECVTHGAVECPDLKELKYRTEAVHVAAHCPECGCYLGNLKQVREEITDPAVLLERFREYRRQARAAGHMDGSAWHRFRHDFGRNPDRAWMAGENGGAK
jgi:hypothetical protein